MKKPPNAKKLEIRTHRVRRRLMVWSDLRLFCLGVDLPVAMTMGPLLLASPSVGALHARLFFASLLLLPSSLLLSLDVDSEEDVSKNKRFQAVIRQVRALATEKVCPKVMQAWGGHVTHHRDLVSRVLMSLCFYCCSFVVAPEKEGRSYW